jgi:hypothetical protein
MNPVIWPAIVEIGFITWRSMTGVHYAVSTKGATGSGLGKGTGTTFVNINDNVKRPPLPSELLAVMLAFGVFGAIAEKEPRVGSLLAWGIVLATGFIAFGQGNTTPASSSKGG